MAAAGWMPVVGAVLRDWRGWPENIARLWRRSLQFRTVLATLALTAIAVLATSLVMSLVIQTDLFDARKDQVLNDARNAVANAQRTLDASGATDDAAALPELWADAREEMRQLSSSKVLAVYPIDTLTVGTGVRAFTSGGLSADWLSPALRQRVVSLADRQAWQSVALPQADGTTVPGIIVGQQLFLPSVGAFEVYIAYDLAEADQTLQFLQRTLWAAGSVLVTLIGLICWAVLRFISKPIEETTQTSARFAAGDLTVRMQVQGEDEIATLGRSFNAMADSIEGKIKELAELSLVQQRFVSDVSHELRTPLTTIKLASDILNSQRGDFDPTTARTAELLYTQVQRFETLLSDLLEISRYDAGSVQLEREPAALAQIAEDIIEQMDPLADQHGTELRLVAPGGYTPVDMDPRRIRRILRNLVGNAIEHGERRPVVVTVDSNQEAVAVGVRDFGLGMPKADAERVFDRFWRADPSRQRTIGGTGLGLSIALGDASLHGGTLMVWSQLGAGTNFVLTLPRGEQGLHGRSPVALEPQDALTEVGVVTQPLAVAKPEQDSREADPT